MSCGQSGIYIYPTYIYPTSVVSVFLLLLHTSCMEPLLTRSGAIVFLSPGEAGISGGRHGRAHQSKPEPDTPLLKNKVNHNMCSGLFKKGKKKLPVNEEREKLRSHALLLNFGSQRKGRCGSSNRHTRSLFSPFFFVCFLF